MASDDPELFLDKKWRTTKKHQHYTFEEEDPSFITHTQQNPNSSSSSKTAPFRFSHKNSSNSSLSKSSSVRITRHGTSSPSSLRRSSSANHLHSPEKSPPVIRSLSKKGSSFTKKCTSLAREQKARFYIMRRCVSMLVRWSKHRDS